MNRYTVCFRSVEMYFFNYLSGYKLLDLIMAIVILVKYSFRKDNDLMFFDLYQNFYGSKAKYYRLQCFFNGLIYHRT